MLGTGLSTLKHGAPRNFAYKGKLMPELVQALRSKNCGIHGKRNVAAAQRGVLSRAAADATAGCQLSVYSIKRSAAVTSD